MTLPTYKTGHPINVGDLVTTEIHDQQRGGAKRRVVGEVVHVRRDVTQDTSDGVQIAWAEVQAMPNGTAGCRDLFTYFDLKPYATVDTYMNHVVVARLLMRAAKDVERIYFRE